MTQNNSWDISIAQFPRNASVSAPIEFFVRCAILAPSAHNSQPWRFIIEREKLWIFADYDRQLTVSDPGARELFISLGCALANIVEAARSCGFDTVLTYTNEKSPKVEVTFTKCESACTALGAYIATRFTDRAAFLSTPVSQEIKTIVQQQCEPDVHLLFASDYVKQQIAQLVYEGDCTQFLSYAYRKELAMWMRRGLLSVSGWKRWFMSIVVQAINVGRLIANAEKKLIEQAPLFCVLTTRGDQHGDHIRVGQSFERIALMATKQGLHVQPMNQGLTEVPEHRQKIADLVRTGDFVQFTFRLGYGESPVIHSMRRPVDCVMKK